MKFWLFRGICGSVRGTSPPDPLRFIALGPCSGMVYCFCIFWQLLFANYQLRTCLSIRLYHRNCKPQRPKNLDLCKRRDATALPSAISRACGIGNPVASLLHRSIKNSVQRSYGGEKRERGKFCSIAWNNCVVRCSSPIIPTRIRMRTTPGDCLRRVMLNSF